MKKKISFVATLVVECDEDWNPKTFEEFEDCDYDSVGRPIYRLEDEGWKITKKTVKEIK